MLVKTGRSGCHAEGKRVSIGQEGVKSEIFRTIETRGVRHGIRGQRIE